MVKQGRMGRGGEGNRLAGEKIREEGDIEGKRGNRAYVARSQRDGKGGGW